MADICAALWPVFPPPLTPMERAIQQELKRRTVKVRVFPGDEALERLVSAILVEIDEKSASDTKAYIKWERQDA